MPKKAWIAAALLLLAAAAWGQEIHVETSEGVYICTIAYRGRYCGQRVWNEYFFIRDDAWYESYSRSSPSLPPPPPLIPPDETNIKLTKIQWEVVNKLLARYDSRRGDTYEIIFSSDNNWRYIAICEYTSTTKYVSWIGRWVWYEDVGGMPPPD
jgi:hypothetical protein